MLATKLLLLLLSTILSIAAFQNDTKGLTKRETALSVAGGVQQNVH